MRGSGYMMLPHGAVSFDELKIERDTVLTIGVLDGVHIGHQYLLRAVANRAREIGACSCVITFYPHPQSVVAPDFKVQHLATLEDRIRLIIEQGINTVAVLRFNREVSRMTAEDFIDLLLQRVRMKELWVGPDFALGYRRMGTVPVLEQIGEKRGFAVRTVPALKLDALVVSSTEVRRLLSEGDVEGAAKLLGRHYVLVGEVVSGFQRGRAIGVPTANIEVLEDLLIPADGVYAVHVHFDEEIWAGVLSIGRRPTFDDGERRTVEVHILGFDGDLYGKVLRIAFVSKLRDEVRFASVDELVEQIRLDIEQARVILRR